MFEFTRLNSLQVCLVDKINWEFIANFITIIKAFWRLFVQKGPCYCEIVLSVTWGWLLLGVVLKRKNSLRVYLGVWFSDLRRAVLTNFFIILLSSIEIISCNIAHTITIWMFAFPDWRVAMQWIEQYLHLLLLTLGFWRKLTPTEWLSIILTSVTKIPVMLLLKILSPALSLVHDLPKTEDRLVLKQIFQREWLVLTELRGLGWFWMYWVIFLGLFTKATSIKSFTIF